MGGKLPGFLKACFLSCRTQYHVELSEPMLMQQHALQSGSSMVDQLYRNRSNRKTTIDAMKDMSLLIGRKLINDLTESIWRRESTQLLRLNNGIHPSNL